ncbi:MAG: Mbeg1-like protein [Bacilli bacterium]
MNIINYIKKNGDISFEEKEINEVDKLIFSLLSYVTYDGVVSNNEKNKKTIKEVSDEYFKTHTDDKQKRLMIAVKVGKKVLKEISEKKRFQNLYLYNDIYLGNEYSQFSALTIEISPGLMYISFEGTDQLMSGWEEDFKMSYHFPVTAQIEAIKYLNKRFTLGTAQLIIGGHSKGGNLALVSSMYSNYFVRRRIIEIISYDGPGLRKEQINSKRYTDIKSKYHLIIPNYSLVGLFLSHENNYTVVKTNKIGPLSHNSSSWQIVDDKFMKTELSSYSKIFEKGISNWLDKYNDLQREKFVKEVFKIFKQNNITELTQITADYKLIRKMIKDANQIDKYAGDMLKELINVLIKCNKDTVSNFFDKNKVI